MTSDLTFLLRCLPRHDGLCPLRLRAQQILFDLRRYIRTLGNEYSMLRPFGGWPAGQIQAQRWGGIIGVPGFSFTDHAVCLVPVSLFFLTQQMRSDGEKPASSLEDREKSRLESPRFLKTCCLSADGGSRV